MGTPRGQRRHVGISQFAVEQLGDVTQVDLPREGEMLKQHDAFGSVESVKAVSDIFSPSAARSSRSTPPCMIRPNT